MTKTPPIHKRASQKPRKGKTVNVNVTADTGAVRDMVDEALAEVRHMAEDADLAKHVGRFLAHPDCKINHPSMDLDLSVIDTATVDGVFMVDCTHAEDGGLWRFPLSEIYPAGPFTDFQREMVRILGRAVVEDVVAQLVEQGALKKPNPADLPAFRVGVDPAAPGADRSVEHVHGAPSEETVHNLGVHPEYVIDPKSTGRANPVLPDGDE